MANSKIDVGQQLLGKLGTYKIMGQLHRDIWTAIDSNSRKVVVKTAPKSRLQKEREVLESVHGHPSIRRMIDTTNSPPSLILEHLDDNLLNASNSKSLEKSDIKFVARKVLEALTALHEQGYVHTDTKPDNILVNYGNGPARFSEVQLADCGDTWRVDPNADPSEEGHIIGAPIFRSPEAMLSLRWKTSTDIWSFGATIISLIWGNNWHIFRPADIDPDSEDLPAQVLVKQISIFGPLELRFKEIADEPSLVTLAAVINYIHENDLWKPFSIVKDKELAEKDRKFILKIMKLDPRDRPTARALLQDEWFEDTQDTVFSPSMQHQVRIDRSIECGV